MSETRVRPAVSIGRAVAMLSMRPANAGIPFFHRPKFTRATLLGLTAKYNAIREAEKFTIVEKRKAELMGSAA